MASSAVFSDWVASSSDSCLSEDDEDINNNDCTKKLDDETAKKSEFLDSEGMHTCVMSALSPLSTSPQSPDACTASNPLRMLRSRIKLHYFVHYLHRATFDRILPPQRVVNETFVCNLCQKPLNHESGKPQGRIGVLCHLAVEHGLLLETMVRDNKVDMSDVIHYLYEHDQKTKDLLDKGVIPRVKASDITCQTKINVGSNTKSVLKARSSAASMSINHSDKPKGDGTVASSKEKTKPKIPKKSSKGPRTLFDPLPSVSSELKSKPYIRKRPKMNINWDEEEDSEEWSQSEDSGANSKQKKKKKKKNNVMLSKDELVAAKSRFLPKRLSTSRKIQEAEVSDDDVEGQNTEV